MAAKLQPVMYSLFAVILVFVLNDSALSELVPPAPLILPYHNGPVLSQGPLRLYLLFYGSFSDSQKSTIGAFLSSVSAVIKPGNTVFPTVQKWWSLTQGYVDLSGQGVAQNVEMAGEISDDEYSLGKHLTTENLTALVLKSLRNSSLNSSVVQVIFTAADVWVEGFCEEVCGRHFYTYPTAETQWRMLPYAWVGDSESQCPGFCAWPYAKTTPGSGPPTDDHPLIPPNGVGVDGMITTLAKVLAGAATNPYGNAFYEGDASAALEAAGACAGSYGPGSFSGYPGELLKDNDTAPSYNVHGIEGYKFLVPWVWNPHTFSCAGQP